MKHLLAATAGIALFSSAMVAQQSNTAGPRFIDMRSWLQSTRPVVQPRLLFYSDGQFGYKLTIQESRRSAVLQWVIPQHQSFGILGTLKDGSLLRDTNPRTWTGDITLRVYGEDEYFTRNWKDVTIVMERSPQ